MVTSDVNTIWNKIERYPYVSFDIFDTLIKRNVSMPSDVFSLVEQSFITRTQQKLKHNFKEMRILAERKAREVLSKEEVTLDDIYQQLKNAFPESDLIILKELEIEIEYSLCIKNVPLHEIYQKCLRAGKHIIITSDMYLPQAVIEGILSKCGYDNYEKLFLSSAIGLKKSTGNLYRFLLKDLSLKQSQIVHIGDNKHADGLYCVKAGIRPILIERNPLHTSFVKKEDVISVKNSPYLFVNNQLPSYKNESELFRWGYEAFGPLLLGFSEWIHESAEKIGVENLFFLARDMNLIIQVYKKLYPTARATYLEVSRKSLRVAYINKLGKINAIYDTMNRVEYTLEEICDSIDIDTDQVIAECKQHGVIFEKQYKMLQEQSEKYDLLEKAIFSQLREKEDYTLDYLSQQGLLDCSDTAIVDIGWHGTIQNMLETITGRKMQGFYFGNTQRCYFDEMNAQGYWFDSDDEFSVLPQLSLTFILEVMLFPCIGTTVGYKKDDESISATYGACEMDETYHMVREFQEGALRFIDDIVDNSGFIKWVTKPEIAVKAYENLAFHPSIHVAKKLSCLPYENRTVAKLAEARSLGYYLLRPQNFIRDYKKARWKPGFIKQVLPFIKDPYLIDTVIKNRNRKAASKFQMNHTAANDRKH